MSSHDIEPDGELTPDQIQLIEQLTDAEIQSIDNALLTNACDKWRKVARVVGTTMMELPNRVEGMLRPTLNKVHHRDLFEKR